MKIIEDLIGLTLKLLVEVLEFSFRLFDLALKKKEDPRPRFNASFGSARTFLRKKYSGFCLSGRANLSAENSFRNSLIIGGTGTGKSSVVLLPSLYTMKGSFIVHDPSGELYDKSAGYLKSKGYEVKILNFANPSRSDGYNPLEQAKSSSDINKVAAAIIQTSLGSGGNNDGSFWNTQAVDLLSVLIRLTKYQQKRYQTLTNVRHFLNLIKVNPLGLDGLVKKTNDQSLIADFQSYILGNNTEDKTLRGVIATAKSALQRFTDGAIQQVTSYNSIDMMAFRKRKTILYIQNPVVDQRYYAILSSLFFEQLFASLLKQLPQKHEHDVYCLMDEAGILHIPSLSSVIANVRKYRVGILLAVQAFDQLVSSYGENEAETIRTNCFSRMYFTGQPIRTARELEESIGNYEYEDDKGRLVVRPLMTSTQIRTLPQDQALLFVGYYNPVSLKLWPYYKRKKFIHFSQLAPPMIFPKHLNTVPVIQLSIDSQTYHAS